jgi:hypothetical protein
MFSSIVRAVLFRYTDRAFRSRFAIGFLGANFSLPMNPGLAGAVVGLLICLPAAFIAKSHIGIIGAGLAFGAPAGGAVKVGAALDST